ncbi:DNA gyrase subunit A [Nocardioides abyssi]|uniref:DNA topoisomerase (ATP-hydrolyzing) n=1 Tax=Nocardioides abyssi TaxID=3058370 RepID=A0ABT8ESM1_9ACTN|nr:DNA gyrase subunit A [Nocardioides abyssi]MDN4161102.1 hypothetical protein [Nocardioides abyssi]
MTFGRSVNDVRNDLRNAQDYIRVIEAILVAANDAHGVLDVVLLASGQPAARRALEERYGLTEMQATAVLDMQVGRLNALDVAEFERHRQELVERVATLTAELAAR